MAEKNKTPDNTTDRELVISRTFNAPRDLVYKVWTQPEHIIHWWGPNGFTNTIKEMEVKPGGVWRFTMHGPNGMDFPNKITYTKVVAPERLEFIHTGDDNNADENIFNVTVTFEAEGNKTKVTMRMVFATIEERDRVVKEVGAIEGNKQTMDKLEKYLEQQSDKEENEFVISRVFTAPRTLIYKAWTEPEHLSHWWGPKGFKMQTMKLDLRPGGVFHYSMQSPDGQEMWGKFVYREVTAPEHIVFVNSFCDKNGNIIRHPMSNTWPLEILNKLTLTEDDGKTTLTIKGYPVNATEEEIKTFMESRPMLQQGFDGTFGQLDAYLIEMK